MSWGRRCGVIASLVLLVWTLPIAAEQSSASGGGSGYVCYPSEDGSGWQCDPDTGQAPPRKFKKPPEPPPPAEERPGDVEAAEPTVRPDAVPTDEPAAEPAAVAPLSPAQETLAVIAATVGDDPESWYTPTPARPVDPELALREDVAAAYYREGEYVDGQCSGTYTVRDYAHPATADNATFPIVAEADQLQAQIDVTAELEGNVNVAQGNRHIAAPRAEIEYESRIARFPEGVRMDQPGLIMQGQDATVHLNTKQADLTDVQFVMTDASMRGSAGTMAQNEQGDLTLTATGFTRCPPNNNGWRLNAKSLMVEQDEVFGTAKGAVLRMKSVPVFYTPYLKFPVSDERVSGFLFPNLSYSEEDGTDISVPYYFNLAPNYDATFVPRYLAKRGAGAELELRHMSSWQQTTLSGALLPDDDIFDGRLDRDDFEEAGGEAVLGPFEPADRWLGAMDHRGRIGPFRTLVDYTSVSDADYFRDLGSDLGVSSRVELERRGQISLDVGGLSARLWAQRFQRLDVAGLEEYQRLPQLDLAYVTPVVGPLNVSLGAQVAEFDRDTDGLNGFAAVTGRRTHFEPRVQVPLSRSWGFLNLTGAYRHTEYDLEQDRRAAGQQLLEDAPDRGIAMGSLDAGLFFERDIRWFDTPLIQTLEPRVFYLYQQFEDQSTIPLFDTSALTFNYNQLFRDNRFSGLDRIGDADQVSVGVTSRFLSRATGREYFRASVGEIYYFRDREVQLAGVADLEDMRDTSALAGEMSAQLFGDWRVTGSLVWDPHNARTDEGGAAIQYRRDNRHILNLGFRRQRIGDIEQTDISLYWPLTERIAVLGRWNQDLESKRTIEGFGGLEYSDCCLQVRLVVRRFLDSRSGANIDFEDVEADDGIFLHIVFKGLAGFGTKVESVLERGIRGYRAPVPTDYFSN